MLHSLSQVRHEALRMELQIRWLCPCKGLRGCDQCGGQGHLELWLPYGTVQSLTGKWIIYGYRRTGQMIPSDPAPDPA